MVRQLGMYVLGAVLIVAMFSSCQERMVCPAYQSTYILDDSVRSTFFSRFEADSTPKKYAKVDRTQFGLIKKDKKSDKLRKMRTIAMRDILPPKEEPDTALTRNRSVEELNRMKDELEQPSSEQ